jgi:hypothetical protein
MDTTLTTPQILFIAIGALAVSLLIFYFIIQGAVKSGTKDIVEELRKQREKEPV